MFNFCVRKSTTQKNILRLQEFNRKRKFETGHVHRKCLYMQAKFVVDKKQLEVIP